MKDEQKYANIVDMVGDFNNDKNLILQLTQQLTDLEAKLAESEEAIKYLKGIKRYDIGEMLTENAKLKQQLAEKEKFFKRIMSGEYIPANIAEKSLKLSNQTAIAELEKVKEIVLKEVERVEEIYNDGFQSGFNCCYVFMKKQIDQQINNLRGE